MHRNEKRPHRRQFLQARSLRQEAGEKLDDYDTVLGRTWKDYEALRKSGIPCRAFLENDGKPEAIEVTRICWNHVFKHHHKRGTKLEKLERALSFPLALKLLQRTTTYQEVSREKDPGGNT